MKVTIVYRDHTGQEKIRSKFCKGDSDKKAFKRSLLAQGFEIRQVFG